jgi:hypothetical protein
MHNTTLEICPLTLGSGLDLMSVFYKGNLYPQKEQHGKSQFLPNSIIWAAQAGVFVLVYYHTLSRYCVYFTKK